MSQKSYMTTGLALQKAYDERGVQGAIDEATKRGLTTLKYCQPCDAKQPVLIDSFKEEGRIVHIRECAVCGTSINKVFK